VAAALLPFNPASADPVLHEAMIRRSWCPLDGGEALPSGTKRPYLLDLLHDQTHAPHFAIRAFGHVGHQTRGCLEANLGDPDVAVRVTALAHRQVAEWRK